MKKKELIETALEYYVILNAIEEAEDPQKEIELQLEALEMKLKVLGINPEELRI